MQIVCQIIILKNLDNGLQIVAIPMDNNTNVVSVDIFTKLEVEMKLWKKLESLYVRTFKLQINKNLKLEEFDEIVKGFGGVNNAGTSFDYTHYYKKLHQKYR